MADDRPVRPAPKPSQKAAVSRKEDAVLEGVVTFTEEQLRADTKKRQELIAAKEGTPGKELAVLVQAEIERDKAAAPIITAAVKDVKAWQELHGKAAKVTKSLADKLVKLRVIYEDKDGRPDMRGQSQGYRNAAASIYEKAGLEPDSASTVQAAVRYHLSLTLRTTLREGDQFANGDEKKYLELCESYGLNPESAAERQKNRRGDAGGTRLPALRLSGDDLAGMWSGAVTYAHKALELPGDVAPADLSDDAREALRDELWAVQTRAAELIAELDGETPEE